MRNALRYFLMALLLLVVALVSALTTMRLAIQVREVKVPDLRNKTPAEARRLAELDGLAAQVDSSYYSATIPEGRVLSQTPVAGTPVRRGWEVSAPKVSLLVAQAPSPQVFVMPNFVGQPLGSVSNILQSAGFVVGKVTVALPVSVSAPANPTATPPQIAPSTSPVNPPQQAPSPASVVVSQEPAPGQKVLAGTAINFVVK